MNQLKKDHKGKTDTSLILEIVSLYLTKEENAQNTTQWVVPTKFSSPSIPIGAFQVHFERATQDVNLFNLVADTNLVTKKSILHMPEWPEIIEESKILFIPK
jgi:hypothetical protein